MESKIFKADKAHTNIGFNVKHMMFSKVRGNFEEYEAQIEFANEDLEDAKLKFKAVAQSINTNNADRDKHLRSADFFNSEANEHIEFESTEVSKKNDAEYVVKGNLTMNGITKPVELEAEYSKIEKDPWGNERVILGLKGKVNREEWGMTYNSTLETGGVLLGKDVVLEIESQYV